MSDDTSKRVDEELNHLEMPDSPELDPFGEPSEADPFGEPSEADPFGEPSEADPFGEPSEADPFGEPSEADPFGEPSEADPFGEPSEADPFGEPSEADPFGEPSEGDPFGEAPESPPIEEPESAMATDSMQQPTEQHENLAGADPFESESSDEPSVPDKNEDDLLTSLFDATQEEDAAASQNSSETAEFLNKQPETDDVKPTADISAPEHAQSGSKLMPIMLFIAALIIGLILYLTLGGDDKPKPKPVISHTTSEVTDAKPSVPAQQKTAPAIAVQPSEPSATETDITSHKAKVIEMAEEATREAQALSESATASTAMPQQSTQSEAIVLDESPAAQPGPADEPVQTPEASNFLPETAAVKPEVIQPAQPVASPKPIMELNQVTVVEPIDPVEMVDGALGTASSNKEVGDLLTVEYAWGVNLVSYLTPARADREMKQLHDDGLDAEVVEIFSNGATYYRVRIAGFPSEDIAEQTRILMLSRYPGAWISKHRR